ncbi:unnamed protein product [Discosporangium mesarthrocarpum]
MRKSCQKEGCNKPAYYAPPGESKAVACSTHKGLQFVNVHNKICPGKGCSKRPHYGNPGGKAMFCVTHKEPSMVNIHGRRCNHAGCSKQPTFGHVGAKPTRCAGHREAGMVDVVYRSCEHGDCDKGVGTPGMAHFQELQEHSWARNVLGEVLLLHCECVGIDCQRLL